jgi:hypothetical protein
MRYPYAFVLTHRFLLRQGYGAKASIQKKSNGYIFHPVRYRTVPNES